MRRVIPFVLFLAGALSLTLILLSYFPKYKGVLVMFFVYLFFDGYLWIAVRGKTRTMNRGTRAAINILYWSPQAILILSVITAFFVPFTSWNIAVRTWVVSFLFITFFSRSIPVFFLFIDDVIRTLKGIRHVRRQFLWHIQARRNRYLLRTGWIVGLIVWLLLLAGMMIWVYDFKVYTQEVKISGLPSGFKDYRMVQISDVHLGGWACSDKLQKAVGIVNSLEPDIILITGDMFTFSSTEGQEFFEILAQMKSRDGIYCITGNHDYGDYIRRSGNHTPDGEMVTMTSFYARLGWNLLMNESEPVIRGTDTILIAGVENWGFERRFQRKANLTKALKGNENIATQILLSHNPTFWEMVVCSNYPNIDLTLSGHTHGGQVGWETSWGKFSLLNITRTSWAGLYSYSDPEGVTQQLYVNRGLGTVSYAGRVGILPEIGLIVLK